MMPMARENLQVGNRIICDASHNESDESDDSEEQRSLFCANLDERVTEELLHEVFLQAGPIESTRIPKDHSGRQRTFGFITYVHKATVPYALHLYQGLALYKKTLAIKYQGNGQPSPMKNYNSPASSNNRSGYDNSCLRGGHFRDSPPQNPYHILSANFTPNSGNYLDNISKHSSGQRRLHTNYSPYQRKSDSGDHRNSDRERDHNKRRHYNNGSSRHSDQRSGGKNRR